MGDRVLFLDVDGVLNCPETWARKDGQRGTFRICPDRVKLLATMLDATSAMVVLSSTWRKFDDHVAYLKKRASVVTCRLHDDWRTIEEDFKPPIDFRPMRGREIKEWLSRHPEVTEYAIVDDDSDMLPEQSKRFVQTSFREGLTDRHAIALIALLRG